MFFFIFETSMGAINNGYFNAGVESIKDVINNESFYNGNKVKICFSCLTAKLCIFVILNSNHYFENLKFVSLGTQLILLTP